MYEVIEADPYDDPEIMQVIFSEDNGNRQLTMEVVTINKEEAKTFKDHVIGSRGIFEMDATFKQNFDFAIKGENSVLFTGNIAEAVAFLQHETVVLISSSLAAKVRSNLTANCSIERTKEIVLERNQILEPEEPNSNASLLDRTWGKVLRP